MFKAVTFYTDKLKQLKGFYGNVLGLPVVESSVHHFSIKIGSSMLTFREIQESTLYHFAINIPGNQFKLAKYWALERVKLNREDGLDETYYTRFDADAIYFEDPAGNIIELIGRRKVDKWSDFDVDSLLNISETSITTPFIEEVGEHLQNLGIPISGSVDIDSNGLNFLGKKDTFILLVPPGRRWYFSKTVSETSPVEMELNDGSRISISKEGKVQTN